MSTPAQEQQPTKPDPWLIYAFKRTVRVNQYANGQMGKEEAFDTWTCLFSFDSRRDAAEMAGMLFRDSRYVGIIIVRASEVSSIGQSYGYNGKVIPPLLYMPDQSFFVEPPA